MVPRFDGGDRPKLLTLVDLRRGFRNELDADLARYYGGTYRCLRGVYTWTEIATLTVNLPSTGESALYRALLPDDWWWDNPTAMAAAQLERLDWLIYQNGGGKGPRPNPIVRPGGQTSLVAAADQSYSTADEFLAWHTQHTTPEGDDDGQ